MAAYTQFGYGGYPSATQILSSSSDASQHTGDTSPVTQSTITASNAPAQSPAVECRTNITAGAEAPTGALSPDDLSQTSNAAGGSLIVDGPTMGHATRTTCCENGRPIMNDPVSGQTVCSCQYDNARLALSGYSRLPSAGVGVYGTTYPSSDQNPYQSIGVDSSAFYSPLSNPYALKDATTGSEMTAWTSAGLQPTTGYYSYDPIGAYGYGASYDLAARRKNATRESTATLKAWLNEHKKNPYPTKGEKIMLAIITKMTLTQVSTWFANARRRLKKENKMTWEPKNRTDDDDDAIVSDDEKDKEDVVAEMPAACSSVHGLGVGALDDHRKDSLTHLDKPDNSKHDGDQADDLSDHKPSQYVQETRSSYPNVGFHSGSVIGVGGSHPQNYYPYHHQHQQAYYQHQQAILTASFHPNNHKDDLSHPKNQLSRDCGVPIPASKPKIWSPADTVSSKTPPPAVASAMEATSIGQQRLHQIQQQDLQQQQQPLPPLHMSVSESPNMLMSPLPQQYMPNNYDVTLFSRAPTAAYNYPGATTPLHTTTTSNYHSRNISNINRVISINNTPTTPITITPLLQQHPHTENQPMGFPEAQPDTPPQTPPNMKLQSMASNLLLTATRTRMTGTCRSNNGSYDESVHYATNIATAYDYSPRDDCSSNGGGVEDVPRRSHDGFDPLFKSQHLTGFVSPV